MNIPHTIDDRFAWTLGALCRAVAARVAGGAMAVAMITLVWTRVKRAEGKILALLAQFRAGTLVIRASRVGDGVAREKRVRAASVRLPVGFAWLLPMVPCEAASFGSQLRFQLDDPELRALLEASPQARRVLGPVCRMLGIEAALLRGPVKVVAAKPVIARVRTRKVREVLPPLKWSQGVLAWARKKGFGKR